MKDPTVWYRSFYDCQYFQYPMATYTNAVAVFVVAVDSKPSIQIDSKIVA